MLMRLAAGEVVIGSDRPLYAGGLSGGATGLSSPSVMITFDERESCKTE